MLVKNIYEFETLEEDYQEDEQEVDQELSSKGNNKRRKMNESVFKD